MSAELRPCQAMERKDAMNATDELRRMLNERGVEYETADTSTCKFTRWCKNGIDAGWDGDENWEQPHLLVIGFTPAQAIAATLGANEYAIEHNVDGSYKCPICGCVVDYDVRGDDERIITMDDYVIPFNFCPKCGTEVVDE